MPRIEETDNKRVVKEFFNYIMSGNPKDSLPLFSTNCTQHNPYVRGGMAELMDSMGAAQESFDPEPGSQPEFVIKHLIADGDIVVAHTEMKKSKTQPSEGGLRQAHIFRLENGKVVEYWDITQMVSIDLPNAANAFS